MTVTRTPRPGVATVEFAVVSSAALLFVIGLIVGALGVFRYQEVARLAREGARYASVRGDSYANATGRPAATPDDVHQQAQTRPRASSDSRRSTDHLDARGDLSSG